MKLWPLSLMLIFYGLIIALSVKVVMNRYESRTLFTELQQLEQERDKLTARWSRLKLEEGTRINQVVIETKARQEMNMHQPRRSEVKVIIE